MSLGFGVTPINPADLMTLLEKQLSEGGNPSRSITGGGLGSDAFLSLWPDSLHLKNPRSKRFVVIRPTRFPLWQSIIQGAGSDVSGLSIFNTESTLNSAIGFNAVTTLSCFVQINADPEMRSARTVSEDTLSVVAFVLKIFSAVQFWCPKDKDGNQLLREPARVLDGGFNLKPTNVGEAWWVQASLDLETKFTAKF